MSSLTFKDVVLVLKQCERLKNIKELRFGELHVIFDLNQAEKTAQAAIPTALIGPEQKAKAQEQAKAVFEEIALKTKEDRLEHMLIEDPLQYEKLIMSGELEEQDA